LQDDAADRQIEMLVGAMQCLNIADPKFLSTDVGPVIDADAQKNLLAYQASMQDKLIFKAELAPDCAQGYFVAPAVYEIDNLNALQKEVFGPILHIYRYKRDDVDSVVEQINAWGYGLTFGIHSRIESFVKRIEAQIDVGNIYINRNIVGAVVGVQPFGGCGLSGTGPKAGGPDTLSRLSKSISTSIDTTAVGGNASLLAAV
jgi:RHH-type transcriptional regulator, proline utilization regulon repressor / proline dehydrogenase / delta 1-pyrroline-5-carboxylate dehydrogenase